MTRLKSLEVFGFKSFADRTRFDFPDGITVVVGPNGSGKSNVVDAIKWVLGEQSARSLRGKEMTDVIFAGSASRKPLNVAEVALVFDNGDGSLPVASADVQIMRRVYRSGESEYLVNGEPSRLRDIRELFSGTGAATEAYSVIEQGRVDALLVASGRDRRAVFEEAAGITRFRVRRAEALRRLERAEADRRRLADIVEEVAKRLDTVRAQAAKARRWKQMTDRLRKLRVIAAGQDLSAIDEEIAGIARRLATARDELALATADVAAATDRAAHVALATEVLQPELVSRRAEVAAEAQRAAEKASVLAVHRARRTDLESELARAAADRESARVATRAAAVSLEQAEAAAANAARELDAIAARLDECTRAAAGSDQDAAERHGRLEAAATALEAVRLERQRLDGERRRAEERAVECRQTAARAHDSVMAQRARLTRLEESCVACEANVGTVARRIDAAVGTVESLDATLRARGEALETAWAERAGWLARSEACRERRTLLQEIVGRHDGVGDAARRLLDGDSAQVPGLVGLAADLFVASEQWAPLVDLAIGTRGQSLVVSSLDDAIAWHAGWAGTSPADAVLAGGGRVGFLAIDTLRDSPGFEPPPHPGLVGRLDRLLAAERGDDPGPSAADPARILAERMLAGVWVVERIEHALPWIAAAPPGTLFMTPAGQCLSADGMFEIGRPAASTGLVARRSELRSLDVRAVELEGQVAAATSRIELLQAEIAGLREAVREAHARRQVAAEEAAASRSEYDRVQRERAVAREQVAVAEQDVRHAEQALADALAALRVAGDAWAAAGPAVEDAEATVALARTDVDELRRGRDEAIEAMHRLRIDEVAGRATLAHGREIVETRRAAVGVCRADLAAAVERHGAAAARLDALEMELLAASAEHAEVAVRAEAAIAALLDAEARHAGLEAERRQAAADGDAAREASSRLSSSVHARELEAGEAGHRRARIVERIRDEYGIEIETATAEAAPDAGEEELPQDREGLDGAIEELRRKLASITSVNMEALAESEQLAERLSGLESQLGDVTSAKEAIEQLIARIDEESRRLLGETIETVRGHFQELFERVFGGGQADIVFEEGVDLLEAAVEIVAHPPGKEPRSISLLSGGEKTMTCVALLLAIFRSRPSPFCVLDEVDAALDEANIDRFVGVLRDFLASTQCIVVTHSKKTMAAATTLYGVTMEESGVSKRISVRFEATAASAGSRAA